MSSLTGIIVMFALFGIYGWLSERALVRDKRRARAVTGPHRTEDTNPSARRDA